MTRHLVIASVVSALALAGAATTVQAADCQELLGNNLYRCQVKSEAVSNFELCIQAISPGAVSSKFDMQPTSFFATTLACMCKATKTFASPSFNASTEFVCGNPEFGDAFTGKVASKGKKIKKGHYFFSGAPNAHVVECEVDPTCS